MDIVQEKTDSEKLSWLEKENKRLIAKNNRFLAEIQEQRAKNEELFRRKCEMTAEICNLKLRLMHFRRIMDKKGIEDYKAIDLKYRDLEKEKKSSERGQGEERSEGDNPSAEVNEISSSLKRARME